MAFALLRAARQQGFLAGRLAVAGFRAETTAVANLEPQQVTQYKDEQKIPEVITALTGAPAEEIKHRVVRITVPARNVMQSGTFANQKYEMTWDTQERWENPLMGWGSSADPLSNVNLGFDTAESAIAFAEKNGWKYYVVEPHKKNKRIKNYGNNFHWSRRVRKPMK